MTIDERSILEVQVQALVQELARVERKFAELTQIDANLRERVRILLTKKVNKFKQDLNGLRGEIENGVEGNLVAYWDSFRSISKDCKLFFREYLALMEGALVRGSGLDDGLCKIADALLDYLSYRTDIHWGRFTILAAEGESFADMAQIVRLRFPEESIWSLPIAGHEFGHFVGIELKVSAGGGFRYPLQDILERESQRDPRRRNLIHEHFADLFATFALGPAYACTCVLLRFDPATAYQREETHPNSAKRVYWMLKALRQMDEDKGGVMRPYQHVVQDLEDTWSRTLKAAEQDGDLELAVTEELDELFDELYHELMNRELAEVRYDGWLRAQMLADELHPEGDVALDSPDKYTLPDVFNAAWLCRMQNWNEGSYVARDIGIKATRLCREISQRVGQGS